MKNKKLERVGLKVNRKTSKKISMLENHVKSLLKILDIEEDNNTKETPNRVARAMLELTQGYKNELDSDDLKFFETKSSNRLCIDNIPFNSLCSHHLLPFSGNVFIEVTSNSKGLSLGLSKFKRIVDIFSKRLQLQETLTQQICDYLGELGIYAYVRVKIVSTHTCIGCRGIQTPQTVVTTEANYVQN
jgi:GTP cyclohydrolase I